MHDRVDQPHCGHTVLIHTYTHGISLVVRPRGQLASDSTESGNIMHTLRQLKSREFLAVIAGGSAALCLSGGGAESRRTNEGWQCARALFSSYTYTFH